MIERFIQNEISLKRWRVFRSMRSGFYGLILLTIIGFFSITAELWANSRPLYLSYQGKTYFPVFQDVHPTVFGFTDILDMNYKRLVLTENDSIVWPVIRWDPLSRNETLSEFPSGPSRDNLMGADEGGRDVASRLLYGFRYSMAYALAVWIVSSLLGGVLGGLMGYIGGWTDLVGQRVIEVIEALPYLMILITLGSIFKPSLTLLVFFTSIFGWVGVSLYFRAEFLKLRRREFVEAARSLGASHGRILWKHILPNSLTPWISISPFIIAGGVLGLASLDYLGYGLQAPTPSWGELLGQAQKHFRTAWWLAVYPTAALAGTLMLLNLVGIAVQTAFDPRKG
jgi:microcin C transport system permease protein